MSTKPRPLPEWEPDVAMRKGAGWWPPRSIGRIMTIVALTGLAMATYTHRRGGSASRARTMPPLARLPAVLRIQAPTPGDPSMIVAPAGIDDAMIVAAPTGIDDAMIVGPARERFGTLRGVPFPMLRDAPDGAGARELRPARPLTP